MFSKFHAIICFTIILLTGSSSAFTAETTTSTGPAKPAAEAKPKASATTKPAASATKTSTAKPAPKKPAVIRTLDTQLSGYTSQDSDSIYARLSMEEKKDGRTWYARGSVTKTATHVTKTSHVLTYRLDSRHERMRNEDEYNVFAAIVSTRDRGTSSKTRESGYQLVSYGTGKKLDPKTKGEFGLGLLNVRDENTGVQPALIAGIQGSRPLSPKLTLVADILAIQPVNELRSTKLDSDIGLAYQMAPGFYLRLNWQSTNLIRSVYTFKEWDSTVRLSISFRKTTSK